MLPDVPAITMIYNHCQLNLSICFSCLNYTLSRSSRLTKCIDVEGSLATEDQNAVTEAQILKLIDYCKKEQFPVIVAVKGNPPPQPVVGHRGQSKMHLPQFEAIIGFAFAQTYSVGLSGLHNGRSRATLEVLFYVHPEYTRKGVGRSLLDRLLQCLSSSYA